MIAQPASPACRFQPVPLLTFAPPPLAFLPITRRCHDRQRHSSSFEWHLCFCYSVKRRQLVSLVDQLRSAGASTEIDLPRIAVIGNQSAGKSSLVEAISGIKVPRDAGTCTRCPMEIRLRSSPGAWTCRVFLRFETDISGRPVESVREIPFGDAVTNPDAVEAILRRAQLAILNPQNSDKKFFLNLSDDEVLQAKSDPAAAGLEKQLSFSKNLICIDVTGPVTDLAFLDLPGIIANSEEPDDITLIENMVRQSITGNCLILLTITMRDDFQNQKAVLLAKEADPDGKRTIGVLTKPDTLQNGEHPSWLDLLENRRHHLSNGYFVTKQPAPEDLKKNFTYKKAREAETQFFATNEPWKSLEAGTRRHLGTAHLTSFLSDRLGRYIADKLPMIQADLATSISHVTAAIDALPPPPSSDPTTEICTRIAALQHDLNQLVQGSSALAHLIQAKNREDRRFMEAIRATKPVFVPFEAKEEDEIKTWDSQVASPPPQIADALPLPAKPLRMTLDELRAHIEEHKGREVPLNTPYDAKASLMTKALRSWGGIISDTVERMRTPVSKSVNQLVGQHFGASLKEELRSIASVTAAEVLEGLFVTAAARLDENLKLDHIPYTQNQHYFVSTRDAVLAELRSARAKKNGGAKIVRSSTEPDTVSTALAGLSAMGFYGLKEDDLKKLLAADPYETELEAAAQTAAYWQRTIDNVPLIIDASVIRPLPHAISKALHQRLLSGGSQELERLVAESPELAEQRAELNMRKKRLDDAKKVLFAYGR
ncbi:hypothetical protein NBRC10512v2_004075 [Rhodotorula toruloides]